VGTVAVVNAFDDPSLEADLGVYRAQYGLPACTTANGCLRKVGQTGSATALPTADSGWASESALDTEMVSAGCPLCHILLVEANSAGTSDLGTAENYAAAQTGVRAVSNSYVGTETSTDPAEGNSYYNHPGVAILAAAGDEGSVPKFPAALPYVIAVGGTTLTRSNNPRGWSETVWDSTDLGSTGSGCSAYEPKPPWQTDTGCTRRTLNDLAAVADPATGVAAYDSYGSGGWTVFGGTSVATPLLAGMYALANNATPSAKYLYQAANAAGLNKVTRAQKHSRCTDLCEADIGYDGPTGNGTPNGTLALGGPGAAAGPATSSMALSPRSGSLAPGGHATADITTAYIPTGTTAGSAQTVTLRAVGLPSGVSASFSPARSTSGGYSRLTLSAAASAAPGTYHLTITGTGPAGGTAGRSYALTLTRATACNHRADRCASRRPARTCGHCRRAGACARSG